MINHTRFDRDHDKLRLWTTKLYSEFDVTCYRFRLKLKKPVIRIVDVESHWGAWEPNTRTITLARKLIESYPWHAVIEVLRHEMAHMIVNEELGLVDHTHGDQFKQAAARLGITGWAQASEEDMMRTSPSDDRMPKTEADRRMLDKVEKLLALSESSNEHEALLAMQKVQELYSKYNLERLRTSKEQSEFCSIFINHKKKQISAYQSTIGGILTAHFFVEVIYTREYDASTCEVHKAMEILGTRQNVMMAEYVYHFLLQKLDALWADYKILYSKANSAKRSYFLGVLWGFKEKLASQESYRSKSGQSWQVGSKPDQETRALIAIADHQLADFVSYRHPRLGTFKSNASVRDMGSYNDGQRDGRNIVISKPIHKGHSGTIKFLTPSH